MNMESSQSENMVLCERTGMMIPLSESFYTEQETSIISTTVEESDNTIEIMNGNGSTDQNQMPKNIEDIVTETDEFAEVNDSDDASNKVYKPIDNDLNETTILNSDAKISESVISPEISHMEIDLVKEIDVVEKVNSPNNSTAEVVECSPPNDSEEIQATEKKRKSKKKILPYNIIERKQVINDTFQSFIIKPVMPGGVEIKEEIVEVEESGNTESSDKPLAEKNDKPNNYLFLDTEGRNGYRNKSLCEYSDSGSITEDSESDSESEGSDNEEESKDSEEVSESSSDEESSDSESDSSDVEEIKQIQKKKPVQIVDLSP